VPAALTKPVWPGKGSMPHALHVQAELINLNHTARPTPASAPDTLEPRVLGRLKLPISVALTLKALTLAPARTAPPPATGASTPTPPTTRAEPGRAEAARAGAHVGHVKLGHTRVALSRTKGVARDEVRSFPLQSVAEASPSAAAAVPGGAGQERAPSEEEEERGWRVELQLCFRLAVSLDSIHTHAVTIDCSGGGEVVCEEEEQLKMDRVNKEHHTKQQIFAQNQDTKEKMGHVNGEEESLQGNTKTVAKKEKSDGVKEHEVDGGGAGAGVQRDDDDGGKARRFRQLLAMVCSGRGAAAAYRLLPLPTAGEAAIRAR
jgi:hypothetical protein